MFLPSIVSPSVGGAFPIPVKASPSRGRKVRSLSGTSSSPSSHRMADAFPTISYSSSEDEDDAEFFDANEYENDRLVPAVFSGSVYTVYGLVLPSFVTRDHTLSDPTARVTN